MASPHTEAPSDASPWRGAPQAVPAHRCPSGQRDVAYGQPSPRTGRTSADGDERLVPSAVQAAEQVPGGAVAVGTQPERVIVVPDRPQWVVAGRSRSHRELRLRREPGELPGPDRAELGVRLAVVVQPARGTTAPVPTGRSEEHTSELQSRRDLVCRLLL